MGMRLVVTVGSMVSEVGGEGEVGDEKVVRLRLVVGGESGGWDEVDGTVEFMVKVRLIMRLRLMVKVRVMVRVGLVMRMRLLERVKLLVRMRLVMRVKL